MSQAVPNVADVLPVPRPPTTPPTTPYGNGPEWAMRGRRGKFSADGLMSCLVRGSAAMILIMMGALVTVLVIASAPSIRQYGVKFLTHSTWRANELPVYKRNAAGRLVNEEGAVVGIDDAVVDHVIPPEFGAAPVIYGTAISSVIALAFAVPLSLGAALYLVRIATRHFIAPVSFLIEFLAAVPSIAYGIWGLFVLRPFLQDRIEPGLNRFFAATPGLKWLSSDQSPVGLDMLCGGLILGIMILPIITAVARDVLRAVPRTQIEGTLALGATWWQSSWEMLRYSRSGLFGAIMLGLARAAGETMAVTMVIGNVTQIKASPFAAAQTMSSLLASKFAEAEPGLERSALLEVSLILLLMSLLFNIVARYLVVGKNMAKAA